MNNRELQFQHKGQETQDTKHAAQLIQQLNGQTYLFIIIYLFNFFLMIKSISFRLVYVIYECINIFISRLEIVNTTEQSFTSDSTV